IPSTLRRWSASAKGKASAPYEFGVKASVVTTNARAPGGQFVLHARALPGNPYDGHTLGAVIEATERLTGRAIERAYVDKGYRGHHTPNPRRVFMSGQKRGVFGRIKRELRRRSAIEAVIGHMKAEGHLGRCYLKGRAGDAANVILSAVGYNLRLVRRLISYYGEVRHLHRLIAPALPGAFSHSITSSAIASSVGGTVRPSALTEVVPWLGAALGLNYPFGGKPVAQSQPRREKESAWRRFNGYDDV